MLLEICASSYKSAYNAQIGGAKRIELCSELGVGGITPSYGFIKQVVDTLDISVFVLIRPRSGNFVYSKAEFKTMKHNIKLCKEIGCSGIVSGVLKIDNSIDIEKTKELVELAKPLPFTFHRAFDFVENPQKAIKKLIDIGVTRVLSSGQQSNAQKGIDLLIELQKIAQEKLIILPGGGINAQNAFLFKDAAFQEIHSSASIFVEQKSTFKISMNSPQFLNEKLISYSDVNTIKNILSKI